MMEKGTSRPFRVAVSGYYGCGNAGDEAVLAGICRAFAIKAGDRVRLLGLSQNPRETERLHGIESVDRMDLSALRRTLKGCDMLLSGGGSLLQDTTSMRSLLYYLWVARLAYSQRVPLMFYAQGLGPLRRTISRRLVRIVANQAAYITVRDAASAALLASIGVNVPPVEVTADPAFALEPADHATVDRAWTADGLPERTRCIGVALRPWRVPAETAVLQSARLLVELREGSEAHVVLLPMHVPDDVEFADAVAQATGRPEEFLVARTPKPPETTLGMVARMEAVVAMRLHALIFAARAGVPPFALAYDPKVTSLMRALGLSDCTENWNEFDPGEVAARVVTLAEERDKRSMSLRLQAGDLERLALRSAECAMSVLGAAL